MPRILLVCLALAACGADGAPEPPSKGVSFTDEAAVGLVIR
jgi:hypothetical protein